MANHKTTQITVPTQAKATPHAAMTVGRAIEGTAGHKTFIHGTAKLIAKLERELDRIKRASIESGANDVADHSYNFIMTAFNLAGWDHVERGGTRNAWDAYVDQLETDCTGMKLLRIVATHSKHGECQRDDGSLDNVRVSGVAKYTIDPSWPDGIPPNAAHILNLDMSFWPKMDVDGQSRQAIEIFEAVVMFWRGRLGVVNPGA